MIRTYDGRRAIIFNAATFTNAVTVNTACTLRRTGVDVGIGHGKGIAAARAAIPSARRGVEGLVADPAPRSCPMSSRDRR
ncbi:hypothetical protein [Rubellimicrobium roseum]|uniref:Uncharacterized protein n=1 Tax=Rubellimicrobium roseum TaxID=687525 RepID=A0A5C4NBL7_9RHOB|nr:hypothetical protein [Rubellimicrobium roseum]TNC66636.1 hypothetical protein FHG71_16310 [Rubellimicrobium roseum]